MNKAYIEYLHEIKKEFQNLREIIKIYLPEEKHGDLSRLLQLHQEITLSMGKV